MTKPTSKRTIPLAQLTNAIVQLLATDTTHKLSSPDIARMLGYSNAAVRPRLTMLADTNQAHRTRNFVPTGATIFFWHSGPAIAQPAAQPKNRREKPETARGAVERRISTKHYPLVNRRDPFVAALFGPAGAQP